MRYRRIKRKKDDLRGEKRRQSARYFKEVQNMKISNREEFEKVNVFGTGAPNDAFAQYFTGQSF